MMPEVFDSYIDDVNGIKRNHNFQLSLMLNLKDFPNKLELLGIIAFRKRWFDCNYSLQAAQTFRVF